MDGNARQVLVTETKHLSFWRKPLGRSVVLCVMTGLLLAFVVFPMFHADTPVDAQTYERLAADIGLLADNGKSLSHIMLDGRFIKQ